MQSVKMGGKNWVVVAGLTTTVVTEENGVKYVNNLGLAVEEGGSLPALPQVIITGKTAQEAPKVKGAGGGKKLQLTKRPAQRKAKR